MRSIRRSGLRKTRWFVAITSSEAVYYCIFFNGGCHARSVTEVLDFFGVGPTKGLTDSQVIQRARHFGKSEKRTPFWKLVLKQFDDLLVKILIAAAFISLIFALISGETGLTAFLEPSVILWILAANAAVGVITETNAEMALEELHAYQADVATVLRNGCFSILPATDLVPGDIVEVVDSS
ncbi:hypothetical protein SLE2022_116880 [Rubroshorea leprosula]